MSTAHFDRAVGSCPSCGAQVGFKIGSAVVVRCEFCGALVARTDLDWQTIGKVAPVLPTLTPLRLGLRGADGASGFQLVGHLQLAHPAGGRWDEWLAAFDDGRWGWLAEAAGRYYLTFRSEAPSGIAHFDALSVGQPFDLAGVSWTVHEKNSAALTGAEGELPETIEPGTNYSYADLSGPQGEFATIDYGHDPPAVFQGREVTLDQLGLAGVPMQGPAAASVALADLGCPQCGGSIRLAAPDQAQRVSCVHCGSLLGVEHGKLSYLTSLENIPTDLQIPIGKDGVLNGESFTCIGYLQRSVRFEEIDYPWDEYLLYSPTRGFRWLTCSDRHWSLIEPVPPGEVSAPRDHVVRLRGTRFRLYQDAIAKVDRLAGEFYWAVSVGDRARAQDYIRPPQILTLETSQDARGGSEINASLGTYLLPEVVERAFGVSGLGRPTTIGWNQPYPHAGIGRVWVAFVAAVVAIFLLLSGSREEVLTTRLVLEAPSADQPVRTEFIDALTLNDHKNIRVTLGTSVNNSWVALDGDFYDTKTGLVQPFALSAEYYSGVEGGESWSEGSRTVDAHLSALPTGTYGLRLAFQRAPEGPPIHVSVKVEQGVRRWTSLLLSLLAISIIPIGQLIHRWSFEARRWQESDYNPYAGSEDDDE